MGTWTIRGPASGVRAGRTPAVAGELAQSFAFSREKFDLSYPAVLASEDACLLVAADGDDCVGYVLGFRHLTFYANGPVGWVEELLVTQDYRGRGLGRSLLRGSGLHGIRSLPAQSALTPDAVTRLRWIESE